MHLNPLVTEDNETKATRASSFYTAPPVKDALSAEILGVSKLHEALSTRFQTIVTSTASASLVSEMVEPVINAWVTTDLFEGPALPRIEILVSSTQPSAPRETTLSELILGIRTSAEIPFAKRLAERLEELVEISEEEFPEQEPMSSRSLQDFIEFIRSVPDMAYPDIVLSYEGNVCAEWTQNRNKHFALEFLGDREVDFVIFAPDRKKRYKTNRVSGISTLDSLLENVHPYGVFDWITTRDKDAA